MKKINHEKLLPWLEALLYVIMGGSYLGFLLLGMEKDESAFYGAAVWPLTAVYWYHNWRKLLRELVEQQKEHLRFLRSIHKVVEGLSKE